MTDTGHDHDHHGPTFQTYLTIFIALCILTSVSVIVNAVFTHGSHAAAAIIMGVSVFKATLVAMYFMHLKYDWAKLYFLVFPVVIEGKGLTCCSAHYNIFLRCA